MKTLINTNPVTIFRDVQEAFKQGYRFVSGRSGITEWHTGMLEIDLYKQEVEVPEITFEQELDIVYVSEYDKLKFILRIQALVLNGWEIDLNSIDYTITGSKRCKLVHPSHPVSLAYTKEQLQEMDYDELKRIAKLRNSFNKSRDVMVSKVLQFQEGRE